ncbi:hypothetical protein PHYC_01893 [Phycisphaerales bacterium]|nr:hypothetical protein PHYC_01893 [Phycisphaerales bacterium]
MNRSTMKAVAVLAMLLSGLASGQTCAFEWTPLGTGMNSQGVLSVRSLFVYDDGSGSALYAGGQFQNAGGTPILNLARWNGSNWSAVGGDVNGTVFALASYDDGGGPALYASGSFGLAGGVAANRIAKWNGTTWSPLLSGTNGSATTAMCVFDDGAGPALFVGGNFDTAGGTSCFKIAKWNGTSFSPLGGGIGLPPPSAPIVNALAVYDDGSGPALYIAGVFTSVDGNTVPANRIVRWDGTTYTALTTGLNGPANALAVFNDGNGPALYVGGTFASAGGMSASRIARWDGESWNPLGLGLNDDVNALAVYDDGTGPALYAGGAFTTADGEPAQGMAKWNGVAWSAMGAGVSAPPVNAVTAYDGSLIAGGAFTTADGGPARCVAEWSCNPIGACCLPSGACEVRSENSCLNAGGIYRGDDTTCESTPPCPQPPTGACCVPSGCIITWVGGCAEQQGVYFGDGTTCTANLCDPYVFEAEPNNSKPEANQLALESGRTIVGVSTAATGSGSPDSPDYFLIRTPPAPLGIYRHRITLHNDATPSMTTSLPGLTQTPVAGGPWPGSVGFATTTESGGQAHQLSGTDRVNYWFGFGKNEAVYYKVAGAAATTGLYLATLETTPVVPTNLGDFQPGAITISTGGQGHTNDTHVRVYDANLLTIHGYANDGASINGGAPANLTTTSFLRREYLPGTYYMGIAFGNQATNAGSPCDDNVRAGAMMDFPDSAVDTGASTLTDISFSITDAAGTVAFPASRPGRGQIGWFRFTVGTPCDPDVNCDGAVNGFDIQATEEAVNGDFSNFCQGSADLNGDGSENGFDIETEEQRVNGAPC